MANKGASNLGGIVGGLFGLVIVAAMVGLPLYGSSFESDQKRLQDALREPVERIRRVVLNLDENAAAYSDQYHALGDKKPNLGEFMKVLSDNDKLLNAAQRALNEANALSFGQASAQASLELNRAHALLSYARGRLDANRVDFELYQATLARRQAEALALPAGGAVDAAAESDASKPDVALAKVAAEIAACDADLAAAGREVTRLERELGELRAQITELEARAEVLHGKLSSLALARAPVHDDTTGFAEASEELRRIEARIDALRHGTYAGGEVRTNELGDLLTAEYSGGQPTAGLRALEFELKSARDAEAGLTQKKQSLMGQQDNLTRIAREFAEQAQQNRTAHASVLGEIRKRIAESDAALGRADKAAQSALASLDAAMKRAKAAGNGAMERKRLAQDRMGAADQLEAELYRVIRDDSDAKASVDCLAADIAYQVALVHALQMDALETQAQVDRFIMSRTQQPTPPEIDGKLEELRTAAIARLEESAKLYEAAANGLKNFRATHAGKTVQGKDILWQVEVAQAAVHLLHAQLLDDADAAFAQQEKAYALLTNAVKGREQSPLLAPALAMLQRMQASVK